MIVKTTKWNKIIFNNKLKSDKKYMWYIVAGRTKCKKFCRLNQIKKKFLLQKFLYVDDGRTEK